MYRNSTHIIHFVRVIVICWLYSSGSAEVLRRHRVGSYGRCEKEYGNADHDGSTKLKPEWSSLVD
jgi:hypothetical protein